MGVNCVNFRHGTQAFKLAFCNLNYRKLSDEKYSLIVNIISYIFRNCKLCKFETNPDFLDTISQIISLNNYLDTFLPPILCFMKPLHQKHQLTMKQTFTHDKWLEIRDKLLNFASILQLNEANHHISVAFLNGIICSEELELALKVEHYFSQFEPVTYMSFWNGLNRFLKKLDLLPRFKYVETKCNQARVLYT